MKKIFESLTVLVLIFVGFCFLQTKAKAMPDFYAGKNIVAMFKDEVMTFAIFDDSTSIYDFTESTTPMYVDVKNKFKTVRFDGITYIGEYSFYNFTNIETIIITSSVEEIGAHAFDGCSNLKKVIFENAIGLKTIDDYAFYNCTSLEYIEIPENVEYVGKDSFGGCSSLNTIYVAKGYYVDNSGRVIDTVNNSAFTNTEAKRVIFGSETKDDMMLFVGPHGDVRLLSDCYVFSKTWHDAQEMEYLTTRFYYPIDGAFRNYCWPGIAYETNDGKFNGELQHFADYHSEQEYDITPLLSGEIDEFNFDLTEYIFDSIDAQGNSYISKDLVINTGIAVVTIKKELLLKFFNENQVKPTLRIDYDDNFQVLIYFVDENGDLIKDADIDSVLYNPNYSFDNQNMNISSNLNYSIYSNNASLDSYVTFVVKNTQYKIDAVNSEYGYKYELECLAPQLLTEEIVATLYVNDLRVEKRTFKVINYLVQLLKDANYKDLVLDLIEYGTASQVYTSYRLNDLAESYVDTNTYQKPWGRTLESVDEIPNDKIKSIPLTEDIRVTSSGMTFGNTNKLYIKITNKTQTTIKVLVNDKEANLVDCGNNVYKVTAEGIPFSKYRDLYMFKILDSNGKSLQSFTTTGYSYLGGKASILDQLTPMQSLANKTYEFAKSCEEFCKGNN